MIPQFWMSLQADYDLRRAAARAPLEEDQAGLGSVARGHFLLILQNTIEWHIRLNPPLVCHEAA
jgi:hypothetical protein